MVLVAWSKVSTLAREESRRRLVAGKSGVRCIPILTKRAMVESRREEKDSHNGKV